MKPLIIGHRGACGSRPENTLCSIEQAAHFGASWIEVDVQPTRDDQLVVVHDHQLERCSNGQGRIDQHSLAELRQFDFGSWFSTEFAGQAILTLTELLDHCQKLQLAVNLEVKVDDQHQPEHVVSLFRDALAGVTFDRNKILLSSFEPQVMRLLHQQLPEYRLAVLSEQLDESCWQTLEQVNAYSCNLDADLTTHQHVIELHKAGYQVMLYTVNDPTLYPWINEVDAIFTDYPERFL